MICLDQENYIDHVKSRFKFNRHRAKRNKPDYRSLHRNGWGRSKSTLTLGCRHTVAHYRSTPTLMMGPSRRRLSQTDTLSRWVNIRNDGASNAANHSTQLLHASGRKLTVFATR